MLIVTIIFENRIADSYTLVTNIRLGIVGGGGDQLSDNVLAFVAEGTTQSIIRASALHWDLLTEPPNLGTDKFIIADSGRKDSAVWRASYNFGSQNRPKCVDSLPDGRAANEAEKPRIGSEILCQCLGSSRPGTFCHVPGGEHTAVSGVKSCDANAAARANPAWTCIRYGLRDHRLCRPPHTRGQPARPHRL